MAAWDESKSIKVATTNAGKEVVTVGVGFIYTRMTVSDGQKNKEGKTSEHHACVYLLSDKSLIFFISFDT